ncbi:MULTISPECIES: hypothetical protein [unclassified Halomonas]|uniref:hypothetical protein n=1 Tax=unclassified Halomonas TaxID=2609666 RepID=UPI001CF508AE|nr:MULTISPECIES: hypothetical protein [unclassified Halomonas]UZH08601.1 hypothetical protein OM794_14650 [Halomonas sp. BDJS001]
MSRQARIDPVIDADDLKETVTGWLVIDETVPENEVVVSEHTSKKEAIQAAEALEQRED